LLFAEYRSNDEDIFKGDVSACGFVPGKAGLAVVHDSTLLICCCSGLLFSYYGEPACLPAKAGRAATVKMLFAQTSPANSVYSSLD
jgi:hypothetical protein